jgi:hypothetical protein
MSFPVTTICGSMRYFDRMMEIAHELTEAGWIVLMPLVHVIGPEQQEESSGIAYVHPSFVSFSSLLKKMLDEMHLVKIDMSEAIHVVGEYRGKSTTREIAYAMEHDKKVYELS